LGPHRESIAMSSRSRELQPEPLTEPCLNLSIYTALVVQPGLEYTPVGENSRTVFLHPVEPFHAAPLMPRQRLVLASGPLLRSEEHTSELQSLTNLVCR